MRNNDQNNMTEAEHAAWLLQVGGVPDRTAPSEENIAALVSEAIREQDAGERARLFVEVANMGLAMADKSLGAQELVATSLVLTKH